MTNLDAIKARLEGKTKSEALAIIEEEQERLRPAFNLMVELNCLHYDLRKPGEAQRLGIV